MNGTDLVRRSVEESVMRWRFKPATLDGAAVKSEARVTVELDPYNERSNLMAAKNK